MKSSSPVCLAAALLCSASLSGLAADPKKAPATAKPNPAEAPAAPAQGTPAATAPGGAPAAAPAPEAKPYVLPESVATVDGVEIKKAELEKAFVSMLASQGVTPDVVPAAQKGQAYRMILDEMIVEKILAKKTADVAVSDEEVNATFDKVKGQFGSPEELKSQLEKNGQTEATIKADIRSSLREQKWMESQIKDAAKVTDAEAQDFYAKNPDKFEQPEQVRASHILIRVEEDAKPADVDAKLKQATAVAARVKGGEDFAKVASEVSEDPSAKQNKGDLDFFTKDRMVPEFANAAFSMKKDQISDPVRSKFGYHVIKVTDRKPAEKVALETVKPQLVAYLERQKKEAEVGKIIKNVRDTANVKVNLPE